MNLRFVAVILAFAVMPLVLGAEWLEKDPQSAQWMARHRNSIALFKQSLCMAAIPGLVALFLYKSDSKRR